MTEAAIAANRFGLGSRPGDLAEIAGDPRGWLKAQLAPETSLPAPLKSLPSTLDDLRAFTLWLKSLRDEIEDAGMSPADIRPQTPGEMIEQSKGGKGFSVEGSFVKYFIPRLQTALKARFDTAVTTPRPFFERLVHFWSNHFVVSSAKPATIAMPPSFERDVARAHATGRFHDMLLASTKHPAMLVYLDNIQSVGPSSPFAKSPPPEREYDFQDVAPRPKGLNENLAREILELHTLGVHGGYTQADVTSFAKVITGWGLARPTLGLLGRLAMPGDLKGADLFGFDPAKHEPGPQTIMGKTYPDTGVEQGLAVLADIARHPSTATFVATKLARHFAADDPPPALVARLAKRFLDTEGDLAAVMASLIDSPEPWDEPLRKFKRPEEFIVSTFRAGPGPLLTGPMLMVILNEMGQLPYYQPGPDGWSDTADQWMGADAVWKRVDWSVAAARGLATAEKDPSRLASDVLGPTLGEATAKAIARAESPAQGLALLLASPEFQRR
ncbi:MAG: DUF1800 domain-containing protein [Alphaproteobacteria bacterium]|nr:DUF1800 domain-containing protein [Alphaproteobacteria bacterium]